MTFKGDVLFLFAHQDDEYGIAPRIARELACGHRVACAYLTNGAGHSVEPAVRDRESRRVLTRLGVASDDILFFGSTADIQDGRLVEQLEAALQGVSEWIRIRGLRLFSVYSPAWEGGHPDHDACILVAAALARKAGILSNAWQFPLYNGQGTTWKFFRALKPLSGKVVEKRRLGLFAAFRCAVLCFSYPSQRRTWIPLFPESFVRRALFREEVRQPVDIADLHLRPHDGPLLYERLFATRHSDFMRASGQFREAHLSQDQTFAALRKEQS